MQNINFANKELWILLINTLIPELQMQF